MSTTFPDAHTDEIPVARHVARARIPRFIRTFAVPIIIGWIALIAALAITAIRSGLESWSGSEPKGADDTPMPYVERAAALVNSIFTS